MIRAILLSSFDPVLGPQLKATVPAMDHEKFDLFKKVPKLIDVVDTEQFFVSSMDDAYTANYYFIVEHERMRGGKILLLLTIGAQLDQPGNTESILGFLENTRSKLNHAVQQIKSNEEFIKQDFFSEKNGVILRDILHELHQLVFVNSQFNKLVSGEGGKIFVFSTRRGDPRPILARFKQAIKDGDNQDLKDFFINKAVDEFNLVNFTCKERQDPTCKLDRCPVCSIHILESDAAIFVTSMNEFDFDEDMKDLLDYLKNIESIKNIPVLMLYFKEAQADVLEDVLHRIQKEIKPVIKETHIIIHALVDDDIKTFKLAIRDLLRGVI